MARSNSAAFLTRNYKLRLLNQFCFWLIQPPPVPCLNYINKNNLLQQKSLYIILILKINPEDTFLESPRLCFFSKRSLFSVSIHQPLYSAIVSGYKAECQVIFTCYTREFKIQNSCRNNVVLWGCMFCWQKNKHFTAFWWQVRLLGNWDHHKEVWEKAVLSGQISLVYYANVALGFHRTNCPNTANKNGFLLNQRFISMPDAWRQMS